MLTQNDFTLVSGLRVAQPSILCISQAMRVGSESGLGSAQQVFEGCSEIGFLVAVFDDDGRVEAEAPFAALSSGDRA